MRMGLKDRYALKKIYKTNLRYFRVKITQNLNIFSDIIGTMRIPLMLSGSFRDLYANIKQ